MKNTEYTYFAPLILFTLLLKPIGYIYTTVSVLFYYLSKFIYGDEEKGSMWCWLVNILPLIAIGTKYI